jgi:hypothetical protein
MHFTVGGLAMRRGVADEMRDKRDRTYAEMAARAGAVSECDRGD